MHPGDVFTVRAHVLDPAIGAATSLGILTVAPGVPSRALNPTHEGVCLHHQLATMERSGNLGESLIPAGYLMVPAHGSS